MNSMKDRPRFMAGKVEIAVLSVGELKEIHRRINQLMLDVDVLKKLLIPKQT